MKRLIKRKPMADDVIIGSCPHCDAALDFIPMPYLSTQQRVCQGCGEILQVDVAPMDFERIGANSK